MEKAFRGPYDLRERLGGRLDAAEIAAADPEQLAAFFAQRPALHRFPGSMAARTQDLCRYLVEHHGGRAEAVWTEAADGGDLFARVRALPGFGEQKSRIFVAILAKRLGVRPPGWEEAAGHYAPPGYFSVADVDGVEALARVREYKREYKKAAKAKQ